jgi:hypothetical protein
LKIINIFASTRKYFSIQDNKTIVEDREKNTNYFNQQNMPQLIKRLDQIKKVSFASDAKTYDGNYEHIDNKFLKVAICEYKKCLKNFKGKKYDQVFILGNQLNKILIEKMRDPSHFFMASDLSRLKSRIFYLLERSYYFTVIVHVQGMISTARFLYNNKKYDLSIETFDEILQFINESSSKIEKDYVDIHIRLNNLKEISLDLRTLVVNVRISRETKPNVGFRNVIFK